MTHQKQQAEQLAEDLLGRSFEELGAEEQRVLKRIASGNLIGMDAEEVAALHASAGDRLADKVASWGGSWSFISAFAIVLFGWMLLNSQVGASMGIAWDRYPYIFLNLMLSMLAAIQAPVIMMSQNRQSAKDRISARHDYEVNLRTQLEILRVHKMVDQLFGKICAIETRTAHPADDKSAVPPAQ